MESFKERIEIHRSKLEQNVDVDKLYLLLQQDKALNNEEISEIEAMTTKSAKVGKLLDVILSKDIGAVQSFYLTLQKLYQHILTSMYAEPPFSSGHTSQQGFSSTSVTSDSDDDMTRTQVPESRSGTYRIVIKSDLNSTMSSSFPTFSDQANPVIQSAGHSSSRVTSPSNLFVMQEYPNKSYNWFFKQFERAFSELHGLKQQNAEMIDMRFKYDQVSKEVKHLRAVYNSESQHLQKATAEIHMLKTQQTDLLAEKKQLLDEISCLQKLRSEDRQELTELRLQQRKAAEENISNDGMGEMYAALLDKYETVCNAYDMLREKYPELMAVHNSTLARLNDVSNDNAKLRSQIDEMVAKNEALSLERNGLKQQCTNVIREWNQTLIKHSQIKDQLAMVIRQRDDFCRDYNQTFVKHTELKKSHEALRAEKDAAVNEYALVMSERDTVHKEIEQLQDKLACLSKHVEVLASEKKELETKLEALSRDMTSVLTERDKYKKERNDISGINQDLKHEFQLRIEQQRDMAYEQMEQIIKETYKKTQKEKAEEIDNVTKETENLRKQIEKLKIDIENAEQEAENANKNRDKAFSERDKIVQERESIRSLCDNLRKDRDRAVSDLAKALRDSDEFKRQKNEAVKELKEIKNRYEAMVDKDSRRQQLHNVGHNHSRDSAIDADLQDLGTETMEISVELQRTDVGGFGFEIIGGKDDPQFPNDPTLFVSFVAKGGSADGKLKVNDTILRINSLETVNVDKRTALQALWKSSGPINIIVRRRKSSTARVWYPMQIVMACQKDLGIQVEQGLFISRICAGGLVTRYGVLPCVGDRIISINNIPANSMTPLEVMQMLETSADSLVLDVWRQTSPFSSAGSSPTPISVGIGSPTHDNNSVSCKLSKSDEQAVSSSSWDTQNYTLHSMESYKIIRNSGSQTDSLDIPGLSPYNSLHNQETDKARHSLLILDKAKEKVEKIFRVRHKGQDRDKYCDSRKVTDDEMLQQSHPHVEDFISQLSLSNTENVIAEFHSNAEYTKMPNSNFSSVIVKPDPILTKAPKRDWDIDNSSGTWPKTRGQCTTETSTIMFVPGHKSKRPSIKDIFYSNTESTAHEKTYTSAVTSHSLQCTDSVLKILPVSSSSVFSTSSTSASSIVTQSDHIGLPLTIDSKVSSVSSTPASKSHSHYTVGVMRNSNTNSSSAVYNRAPPAFSTSTPAQLYGTVPWHRHTGGHKGSLVSSHQSNVQSVETTMRTPEMQQFKSRRPVSAPYKPETQWQISSPSNCTTGQTIRDCPVGYQVDETLRHTNRLGGSSVTSLGISRIISGTSCYTGTYIPGQSDSSVHINPSHHSTRPESLEMSQSRVVKKMASGIYEQNLISPPAGQGFKGQSPYYQQHDNSVVFSPLNSANQYPSLSSPSATFPVKNSSEIQHDRPLSFHGVPADHYSSPSPSQKSYSTAECFSPTVSEELYPFQNQHGSAHNHVFFNDDVRQAGYKKERIFERIRIPSSTSVNTKSGSVEIAHSDRSSPGSPVFHIDSRESIKYKGSHYSDDYIYRHKFPHHHETRDITFEKSSKPAGFKIQQGTSGGIFVSSVSDNSLAAQAGLVIGDQLLEVCGINMRNANYKHAVTVLRQCGDNLTIKVQYNPDKYIDLHDASSMTSINSSSITTSLNNFSHLTSEKIISKLQSSPNRADIPGSNVSPDKRRYITLKKSNPNMIGPGFSFVGGNAVGIFVHEVYKDCFVGGTHSLQRGDHILEFNSVDFRELTAEKAMMELTRPCATMVLCVFYNFAKYTKIQSIPCDSFYIKANFDHASEIDEELSFHKDDILYVDNSLYKNQLGTWFAWLVSDQGTKLKGGIIPSRIRLEDELVLRRTHSESRSLHETDDLKGSRRGSGSARRSFFRKKRHHRNSSKNSQEFELFPDASASSDAVPILDDSVLGYTHVEKIELRMMRPVVLLTPLAEALIKKLVSESPDKYRYCEPAPMRSSNATMEQSLTEGVLIDYWKEDDVYKCIRASAVKEICNSNVHCLLSVSPAAIERMHQCKIYPITIFVRHKSAKQIREIRDPQFLKDRTSNKLAKEQFDHFQKIEQEYSHLFSAVIPGGNLAEMCMQIKTFISTEQRKAVWVTVTPA